MYGARRNHATTHATPKAIMNSWRYEIPTWYPEEATTFLGNGFIGGNLPLDGHGAEGMRYPASVVGLYVGPDETAVNVPHWLNVPLRVDGRAAHPRWVEFRQTLDLHAGTFATAYTEAEGAVRVETETFCHRGQKHVAAYRMTIRALRRVRLELSPQLNCARCGVPPTTATRLPGSDADSAVWRLDWGDAEARVAQALHVACDGPGLARRPLDTADAIGWQCTLTLDAGQACTVTGIVATAFGDAPVPVAEECLRAATAKGYAGLRTAHVAAMAALWQDFDIEIGDPYLERKAKACMFYLLNGYRDDVVFGGTATGLSSKGSWGGSVFWDTEFYMFPALLPFFPRLARNQLLYRHRTLPAARQNAAAHGERGARFAWQSKKSGRPFGGAFEEERHISSDVAFDAWWYAQSTGDTAFFEECGHDLLAEVARNWESRAVFNAAADRFELHGVIPSDEHVWDHYTGAPVNNSVMTNAYAAWVLRTAAGLAAAGITDAERAAWRHIADGMYLPRDAARGIFLEYDGYSGHPIKQADVGHLFFPWCVTRDPEEIRRNVYYYAERERETGLFLTHSPSVYAAGLSRAGDVRGVARFLDLAMRNASGPFEVPRESNYATGPVVTGAGSFLNLLFYGVAGIENQGAALTAHPCVPEDVGHIRFRHVAFRGARFTVAAKAGSTTAQITPEPG